MSDVYVISAFEENDNGSLYSRFIAAYTDEDLADLHCARAFAWRNHNDECRATKKYPNPYDPDARYENKVGRPDYMFRRVTLRTELPLADGTAE